MKIRGLEVSKIAEIVIDHKYFWKKSENGIWERDIVVDDRIVAGEAKTQTMMVAHLNEKYFWNPRYKIWVSPYYVNLDAAGLPRARNTLNILKVPPAPPRKPNPNSRTQINKARIRSLYIDLQDMIDDLKYAIGRSSKDNDASHECMCRLPVNDPTVSISPVPKAGE